MAATVHFPLYAKYLRTKLIKESALEQLGMLRQLDAPLLRMLSMKPEAEILQWLAAREESFLAAIEAGEGMAWEMERLAQWEADDLPGIPKGGLHASDIILFHTAHRTALMRFVARYRTDDTQKCELLGEIEAHFVSVLGEALRVNQRLRAKASPGLAPRP